MRSGFGYYFTLKKHAVTTGLQLVFGRVEDGRLSAAVNLTPVSTDPVPEAERVAQRRLGVHLHRTGLSQRTFSAHSTTCL